MVDPADIPSVVDPDPAQNFVTWGSCGSSCPDRTRSAGPYAKYSSKVGFQQLFADFGSSVSVRSLTELIAFNTADAARAIPYGQGKLVDIQRREFQAGRARYQADRARDIELAATRGLGAAVAEHNRRPLLFPAQSQWDISNRAGYPAIVVPFGNPTHRHAAVPGRLRCQGDAVRRHLQRRGLQRAAPPRIAYAFEQATHRRVPPPEFP